LTRGRPRRDADHRLRAAPARSGSTSPSWTACRTRSSPVDRHCQHVLRPGTL